MPAPATVPTQPPGTPGGAPPLPTNAGRPVRPGFTPQGARATGSGAHIPINPQGAAPTPPAPVTPAPDSPAGAAPATPPPAVEVQPPVAGTGGQIPPQRVSEVRERARRQALREYFGTDDPKKIEEIKAQRAKAAEQAKADQEELQRLRTEEEARKRESMSELERHKADVAAANAKVAELERELESVKSEVVYKEQNAQISQIAAEHIDPDLIDYATDRFSKFVTSQPKGAIKRMKAADVAKWFKDFAKANPKFAKAAATPAPTGPIAPEKKPPAPRKVPAATSRQAIGGRPSPAPVTPGAAPGRTPDGKLVKPGQRNSMSKGELREYLRERKIKPW